MSTGEGELCHERGYGSPPEQVHNRTVSRLLSAEADICQIAFFGYQVSTLWLLYDISRFSPDVCIQTTLLHHLKRCRQPGGDSSVGYFKDCWLRPIGGGRRLSTCRVDNQVTDFHCGVRKPSLR